MITTVPFPKEKLTLEGAAGSYIVGARIRDLNPETCWRDAESMVAFVDWYCVLQIHRSMQANEIRAYQEILKRGFAIVQEQRLTKVEIMRMIRGEVAYPS